MSALKPVVDMMVTLKGNQGIDANFNNVRVGKNSLSTAHDGLNLFVDMAGSTEFKVFLTGKINKLDLPWLLRRKRSDQLDIVLYVAMVQGNPINGEHHQVARTEMPDCRLVHKSHHDGGYIVTFLKKQQGDLSVSYPTDPVANPFD